MQPGAFGIWRGLSRRAIRAIGFGCARIKASMEAVAEWQFDCENAGNGQLMKVFSMSCIRLMTDCTPTVLPGRGRGGIA